MSNESKDSQPKKTPNQIGLGLVIGAELGVVFGIFYHNIPMGIIFGVSLGLIFGAALSLKNKNSEFSFQPSNLPGTDRIDLCSKLV
jgi:F0F1-type ATP synthase assembly protein I